MTDHPKGGVPRELERAGALCVAFVNTDVPRPDRRFNEADDGPAHRFEDYVELLGWGQRMGILTAAEAELLDREAAAHPQQAAAELAGVRKLRGALMRCFTALAFRREPRPEDLATLNASIGTQRVVPGPDLDFRREPGGDPLALDRVRAAVAHSAADLLSSAEVKRLRQCGAEGCWRLFVHRSTRRLWCDMNLCGSRLKARRRSRRSARRTSPRLRR